MVRTIKVKLYKYDELSDEAKEKAFEHFAEINVDYEWWESVYEDADQIGLKIKGFDIDRGSYCKGDFTQSAEDVANAIIKNHGESCETYKDAKNYLAELSTLKGIHAIADADEDEELDTGEIDSEFLKSILEDYRIMLQHEHEYQTSKEAIEETIRINEYEFTEDGKLR